MKGSIKIDPGKHPLTQVPTMPTLTTKIYVANKNGIKEESTVRDVIILGQGKAFDTLKTMDCFESLVAQLQNEKERPLEVLTENLRVSRKNLEKAHWWMSAGLYVLTTTVPLREEVEARAEYDQAMSVWQDAYNALKNATGQD
jgi:hypothetical protein